MWGDDVNHPGVPSLAIVGICRLCSVDVLQPMGLCSPLRVNEFTLLNCIMLKTGAKVTKTSRMYWAPHLLLMP